MNKKSSISLMDDATFNFMCYLKYYRPKVHDNFVAITYMGIKQSQDILKMIFKDYAEICKFPWKVQDINVFQIRKALCDGSWTSATWDLLVNQAFTKPSKKFGAALKINSSQNKLTH